MARVTPYAYVPPSDCAAYRELCDGHITLPETHTVYLQQIYDLCAGIRVIGNEPVEVHCNPLEIAMWCRKHACLPNKLSVSRYAVEWYEPEWQ